MPADRDAGDGRGSVAHPGPESWHPNPGIFYARGGGPLLDLGPYSVTALVSLLGPIVEVTAVGRGIGSERLIGSGPRAGETIVAEVPTTILATLAFESGVVGGLTASFDVVGSETPNLEVHGTAGSLTLGDPDWFNGAVRYRPMGAETWEDVPLQFDGTVGRGVGLADFIVGAPDRAPGAGHAGSWRSTSSTCCSRSRLRRRPVHPERVTSRCERPAPLDCSGRPGTRRRRGGGACRAGGRCRPRSRGS